MDKNGTDLKRSPEEKFILIFEAAKRSLLAAEYYLKLITEQLPVLELAIGRLEGEQIAPVLVASLGFVDFTHRFGQLVDQLPMLSSRALELRKLRTAMANVEVARNHVQHLRGDLSTNERVSYPILGILNWSRGDTAFSIYLSQSSATDAASMAYDTVNRRWAARLQLNIKNNILDFDQIIGQMRETYQWIVKTTRLESLEMSELKWGATRAFSIHFEIK